MRVVLIVIVQPGADKNAGDGRVRGSFSAVEEGAHTLKQWRREFLGYFDTGGASNGGTEAIGLIEPARRVARRFSDPDNYRIRMLLIGGGLRL